VSDPDSLSREELLAAPAERDAAIAVLLAQIEQLKRRVGMDSSMPPGSGRAGGVGQTRQAAQVETHAAARDRHRLAEHHHIPAADRPRPSGHQRRAAITAQPHPRRADQISSPHRHHPGPPQQPQADQLASSGHDIAGQRRAD
jgi:hypothetical protein